MSDDASADSVLDTSQLLALAFDVPALEHDDFCIRDPRFFDVNDVEVLSPP